MTSRARCRHCGQTKEFPIAFEDVRADAEERGGVTAARPQPQEPRKSHESASLPARAASKRAPASSEDERDTRQSITVDVPVEDAYRRWSKFEDFPRFMDGVCSVRRRARHLGWKAEICGKQVEWSAEITEEKPNHRLAWESTGGRYNSGEVTFARVGPRATRIDVHIEYSPRDIAEVVGDRLGPSDAQLREDLECFKELVESGGD
jgi:uncharacterized membrane protein